MTSQAAELRPVQGFAAHEHRDLARGINRIDDLARDAIHRTQPDVAIRLRELLHWLDAILVPHLEWEERVFFPEVEARTGTTWSTRTSRFDHHTLRSLILEVGHEERRRFLSGATSQELQPLLFGLAALLRAHIEREERLLIPVLDEAAPPPVHASGAQPARP